MTPESLATRLHAGQTDKAGQPYIDHLRRVVCILLRRWPDATEDEIAAAWLHDALEDTEATAQSLIEQGVSSDAVRTIQAVTRTPDAAYLHWIARLSERGSPSAIRVKLADNEDNRDPARVAAIAGGPEMVRTRYEPARALLEAGLARCKATPN